MYISTFILLLFFVSCIVHLYTYILYLYTLKDIYTYVYLYVHTFIHTFIRTLFVNVAFIKSHWWRHRETCDMLWLVAACLKNLWLRYLIKPSTLAKLQTSHFCCIKLWRHRETRQITNTMRQTPSVRFMIKIQILNVNYYIMDDNV